MSHPDPLVALWQDTSRPLNWRAWAGLHPGAAAQLRASLLQDLAELDGPQAPSWPWRHTHRALLELKMACGRGAEEL